MKNFYLKLNQDQRVIFINILLLVVGSIVLLPFSLGFKEYGLIIGWGIGCVANILATLLIFKSTDILLKDKPSIGLYILLYLLRILIYVGTFIFLVVMQWVAFITVFNWSILTCAVSLLPPQIILMIVYKGKK